MPPVAVSTRVGAVIWDFDGTLVDSFEKNYRVTGEILAVITERSTDTFEAMGSLESYQAALARSTNWRDLYLREFGLEEVDVDRAGHMWEEYQQRDRTATPVIDGIPETLNALQHVRHGIVSQNGKTNISAVLETSNLRNHFRVIIGYEEVSFAAQKPAPDGLLRCVELLTERRVGAVGVVFYVGDHETDALCAARAKAAMGRDGTLVRMVSIGALFSGATTSAWAAQPDHVVRHPSEIVPIVLRYLADESSQ